MPDLRAYRPPDQRCFGIFIQALVGPAEGGGEEAFGITVCTTEWVSREINKRAPRWGHGLLIVDTYSYSVVERAVNDLCSRAVGSDWSQLAAYLARYTEWEFQDYKGAPSRS